MGRCVCVRARLSSVFLFCFFLQHDTYINYIKVPFTGLSSYIALHYLLTVLLKIQLIFVLLSLFYLHLLMYNVIMHTYLEAHHLHTKKEKLVHKKLTVTKDKKAKFWVG